MHIREITLDGYHLSKLKHFYSMILGFDLLFENPKSFSIQAGETVLTFKQSEENEKPFYHFAFNIPHNQFNDAKIWVSSKVPLIKLNNQDEFDFKNWNAHSFYFYDPVGNIIEFIARHNLYNQSNNAFSEKSILNISEIGLPVYSVEKFYKIIKEDLHILAFSGNSKNFLAAGDENGLFIIVPNGRKWFPDCSEAKIFPLSLKIISIVEKTIEFENLPYKISASIDHSEIDV